MKILIDNGHGVETPGKCSPDGRLREWKFTRMMAQRLKIALENKGYDVVILVPEDADVPLHQRVARANQYGTDALLLSLHVNACGRGEWCAARGFSAFVAPKASAKSQLLAGLLEKEAFNHGLGGNRAVPAEGFWRGDFAIIRDTRCPAVLTENMFMDNRDDLEYLLSDKALDELASLHINALKNMI